jgi:hypothetical protein
METLATLTLAARQKADMVNSTFIEDPEWKDYINNSYAELYDLLVSRFEDYYSKSLNFTVASGSTTYALPSDFYKFRGLDYQISGTDYITVRKFNFEERNKINRVLTRGLRGVSDRQYRIMGQNILFYPTDKAQGSYRMWYVPRFTPLANSFDTLGDVMDFHEYITTDAAIKALVKEESDPSALMIHKNELKARIEAMASNRDTQPDRISDVTLYTDADWIIPRG